VVGKAVQRRLKMARTKSEKVNRRQKGEGSIYKNKTTGKYECSISLGYKPATDRKTGKAITHPDGRIKYVRDRKVFRSFDREEVLAQKNALGVRKDSNLTIQTDESLRLEAHILNWLDTVIKPNKTYNTWKGYNSDCTKHILPFLGRMRLVEVQPRVIREWMETLRKNGRSEKTIKRSHSVLSTAMQQAVWDEVIDRNPVKNVKAPSVPKYESQSFTQEEAVQFISYLSSTNHRLKALAELLLGTSCRIGEALAIRWSDINFETGRLSINGNLQQHIGNGLVRQDGTKQHRNTYLTLPKSVLRSLQAHKALQATEQLRCSPEKWQNSGLVFTNKFGAPLWKQNVTQTFDMLLKKAGLPDLPLHSFRHTSISLALADGENPVVVSKRAGHATVAFTLSRYAHVLPKSDVEAADRMDKILYGS
jgi:integrase